MNQDDCCGTRWLPRLILCVDLVLLAGFSFVDLRFAPGVRKVLADLGVELPLLSRLVCFTVFGHGYATVLAVLAGAALVLKEFLVAAPRVNTLVNLCALGVLATLLAAVVVWLFLPLLALIEKLS